MDIPRNHCPVQERKHDRLSAPSVPLAVTATASSWTANTVWFLTALVNFICMMLLQNSWFPVSGLNNLVALSRWRTSRRSEFQGKTGGYILEWFKFEMQTRHPCGKVSQPIGDRGRERCLVQAKSLQIMWRARLSSPGLEWESWGHRPHPPALPPSVSGTQGWPSLWSC